MVISNTWGVWRVEGAESESGKMVTTKSQVCIKIYLISRGGLSIHKYTKCMFVG